MTVPGWAPPERLFHERARAELRAGATGETFSVGSLQVQASALPLLRRGNPGGLEQAIRLIVDSREDALEARFSLELEGRPVDAVGASLRRGRQTFRLFLPEVSRQTPVCIRVAALNIPPAGLELTVSPVRKWRIYIAQQTHFDIGYTDPKTLCSGITSTTWTASSTWSRAPTITRTTPVFAGTSKAPGCSGAGFRPDLPPPRGCSWTGCARAGSVSRP